MNEKHLCRAKKLGDDGRTNKEWVYGYYYDMQDNGGTHVFLIDGESKANEAEPETVCRCTGFRDLKEVLIFENDYISFEDMTSTENGYSERGSCGQVIWDERSAAFVVTDRFSCESYEALDECLVVGNLFDDGPEKLADEQNRQWGC